MNLKSIASTYCPPLWNGVWRTLSGSRQGVKDVIVSAVPQIVGVFTGFFGSVLVARGLGPYGMGQYALVMSLAGVATVLSDLGIGQTAIRYASRAAAIEDKPTQMAVLRWALRWRLSLVFLVTTAFFLIAPYLGRFWHSEALTPYLRLGLLGGIFAALASVPTVYFQSIKRFSTNASVISAQRIISFAGILVLAVFSLWSLLNIILVNIIASAIGAIVFLIIVPKTAIWPQNLLSNLKVLNLRRFLTNPKMQHDANNGLDSSSPIEFVRFHMLSTIIVMLIMQADVWMIGYFLQPSELGIYSVATRFTLPITIALGALNTALWPRASSITDPHKSLRLLKKTLGLTALVACLASIYAVSAPLLTSFLFGAIYEKGCLIGQILCLRYSIAIFACPLGLIGYSFGLVRVYWLINLAQMTIVIFIMLAFLPIYGTVGAAIALVSMEIVGDIIVCLLLLASYRKHMKELRLHPRDGNQERD